MSYDALENSAHSGMPVELYRFARGASQTWLYTSADQSITYNNETYQPVTIQRTGIQHTSELNKSNIQVTVPRDNTLAALFLVQPPDGAVSLTVFRHHRGDNEYIIYWKGRVLTVAWADSTATLKCEPITTSLKRAGLRPRFQTMCRHAIYDAGCTIDNQLFRSEGTITTIAGNVISAAAWAGEVDGWFTSGYVQFGDGGPRRLVRSHVGTDLTLQAPIPTLAIGDAVAAYAGCDHLIATCNSKFSNVDNFGGFPYVPTKNPFGSAGAG